MSRLGVLAPDALLERLEAEERIGTAVLSKALTNSIEGRSGRGSRKVALEIVFEDLPKTRRSGGGGGRGGCGGGAAAETGEVLPDLVKGSGTVLRLGRVEGGRARRIGGDAMERGRRGTEVLSDVTEVGGGGGGMGLGLRFRRGFVGGRRRRRRER